jgi:hypothetical protein
MLSIIIAVFLVVFFLFLIGVLVWGVIRLRRLGLLAGFMRGKWLLSLLTIAFVLYFTIVFQRITPCCLATTRYIFSV